MEEQELSQCRKSSRGRGKGGRNATVYDAVAERVDYEGFLNPVHAYENDIPTLNDAKNSRKGNPVTPQEVLYRSHAAPERYEEDDTYDVSRHLEPGDLPDSDLLEAIHAYVSDFYSRATDDGGAKDMRSMDETALLACGILLEEAAIHALGENGHSVLTEPDLAGDFLEYEFDQDDRYTTTETNSASVASESESDIKDEIESGSESESDGEPQSKRLRLDSDEEDDALTGWIDDVGPSTQGSWAPS